MTFKNKILRELSHYDLDKYPKDDIHAWKLYPNYNFIYDKLLVFKIQNLECGPYQLVQQNIPWLLNLSLIYTEWEMNLLK